MTEFSLNKEFKNLVTQVINGQKQEQEQVFVTQKGNNITNHDESAKSQNFFQDNNTINKKTSVKPCTTTGIKSRDFLSNISYVVSLGKIFIFKILYSTFML